jgi:DNA-binding transcriptional regulator YiaG
MREVLIVRRDKYTYGKSKKKETISLEDHIKDSLHNHISNGELEQLREEMTRLQRSFSRLLSIC